MRTADNKSIVRRFIEGAFNQGNLAVVDELIAPTYVSHTAGLEQVEGPAGMRTFVTQYRTAFPDYHCTINDQVAEGEMVVTRWTVRGTHRGELMGLAPTGKPVAVTGIVIDRIAQGQLVETWLQADVFGMMRQLGAIPVPDQAREAAARG